MCVIETLNFNPVPSGSPTWPTIHTSTSSLVPPHNSNNTLQLQNYIPHPSIISPTPNQPHQPTPTTTMGLLDPFWNAVDTTVAGAGTAVGGAIQSVGDGISQTGRNVGDGIAGAAGGWGSYVNDGANYVKDATGAGGVRVGSAGNPLGLAKSKEAARTGGFSSYTPYKGGNKASTKTTEQKAIMPAAPSAAGKTEQTKARSAVGAQVAADARAKAIAAAKENYNKKKAAGGAAAGKGPSAGGNAAGRGGKVTGRAEALKGPAGGVTNAPTKPPGNAAGRGGKVGGTVTGRGGGAAGAAKKPAGTVTGKK
ncbi:hypothetical protein HO173_004563 [Letharia columbiana]|uniref:Uncharacterized protein n=1 Tax=Letharia columbiana TaxID=112416 RepID=A0A8H6FYD9_9LECA|nr:uncharacterized protein HO173_004563 [Letharia columbiana]KAF6237095.1 hypothetical protein HO173_004563 [Letharia columbiana]